MERWYGREVDRPPPCSAMAKNDWISASTPLVYLHGVDGHSVAFTLPSGLFGWLALSFKAIRFVRILLNFKSPNLETTCK